MKGLRWLDEHFEEAFMMFLLCLMATVMTLQVFMRYLLHSPISWAEEFCRYCQIWSTFASIGYCAKRGIMLQVDLLNQVLPSAVRWIVELFIKLIILAVYGFFFYQSFTYVGQAINSKQVSAAMNIPMYIVYSVAIPGFFLGIVRQIQDLAEHFQSRAKFAAERWV